MIGQDQPRPPHPRRAGAGRRTRERCPQAFAASSRMWTIVDQVLGAKPRGSRTDERHSSLPDWSCLGMGAWRPAQEKAPQPVGAGQGAGPAARRRCCPSLPRSAWQTLAHGLVPKAVLMRVASIPGMTGQLCTTGKNGLLGCGISDSLRSIRRAQGKRDGGRNGREVGQLGRLAGARDLPRSRSHGRDLRPSDHCGRITQAMKGAGLIAGGAGAGRPSRRFRRAR